MMTDFRKLILGLTCLAGMMTAFVACETVDPDNKPEPNPEPTPTPEVTETVPAVFIGAEQNATATVTVEIGADWSVSADSWLDVQPASGQAGTVELTLTALEANEAAAERVGSFVITAGEGGVKGNVVQNGIPALTIASSNVVLGGEAQEVEFIFSANVDFDVTSDVDWIKVLDVAADSVILIEDEDIWSSNKTYTLLLDVTANEGDIREGSVTVESAGMESAVIAITQFKQIVADFSRDFYRRSYVAKYSATWCGPCYMATEYLHSAMNMIPGRIEVASYMLSSSGGRLSDWSGADDEFNQLYSDGLTEGGIPFMIWNNYGVLEGAYPPAYFIRLNDETLELLPAHTGIAATVNAAEGNVDVFLSVASTESADYDLRIFLLEDNLSGSSYGVTNDVIRAEITPEGGETVSLTADEVTGFSYSCEIPSYVVDESQLHVMVVLYRSNLFSSSVTFSTGYDTVVDNVLDIPVNSTIEFEYEE